MRAVVAAILISCWCAAAQASESAEGAYARARDRYHRNLKYDRENTDRNWRRAVGLFEEVAREYPSSRWADQALYSVGLSYEKMGNRLEAAGAFGRMADRYPGSRLADDALFLAGVNHKKVGRLIEAEAAFLRVVDDASDGDMYEKARDELVDMYRESQNGTGALVLRDKLGNRSGDAAAKRNLALIARDSAPKEALAEPEQELLGVTWTGQGPDHEIEVTRAGDPGTAMGRPYVRTVQVWSSPRSTRVVLEFSGSLQYSVKRLNSPSRIYVDLDKAVVHRSATLPIGDGRIGKVRVSQFDPNTARVVFDPAGEIEYSHFKGADPARIVLDFHEAGGPPLEYEAVPVGTMTRARELGLRVRRIAIDPGHGGKDPGAIGPGGVKEKEVALAIAQELQRRLEEEGTFEPFLTRQTDVYVPLEERTAIANQRGADILVSIHLNAHRKKDRSGYETYHLALKATDEDSRAVAAMENAVSMKGIHDMAGLHEGIARTILRVEEIETLAEHMQTHLVRGMQARDRGVKHAPFLVLNNADMPAVLVECGFITNPKHAKAVRNEETIRRIAGSLFDGIVAYAYGLTVEREPS